jgi:hypothetical protein
MPTGINIFGKCIKETAIQTILFPCKKCVNDMENIGGGMTAPSKSAMSFSLFSLNVK